MEDQTQPTVLIVGGGVAGLSAAAYAQMNGLQAVVLEKEPHTGGVCINWRRNGYSINGSMHWLVGSGPGIQMHEMWRELGVLENAGFYQHDRLFTYQDRDGATVVFYTDLNKLQAHLAEIAPEDEPTLDPFFKAIRRLAEHDLPTEKAQELFSFSDVVGLVWNSLPAFLEIGKWSKISVRQFADELQNPLLANALRAFWSSDMQMTMLVMTLAWAHRHSAAYVLGGSQAFTDRLEARARSLGADIRCRTSVARILTEDGAAVGVELANGETLRGDYVISAADGVHTVFQMLEDEHTPATLKKAYEALTPFPGILFFSFGLALEWPEMRSGMVGWHFELPAPVVIGPEAYEVLSANVYNYDPYLAPHGKTLLTLFLNTDYDYWHALSGNEEKYEAAKAQALEAMEAALTGKFPQLAGKIEMRDLATPVTYENHTSNYRGAYEGWLPVAEQTPMRLPQRFDTLKNFYMAGHWVSPGGGLPVAAMTGKFAVQYICRERSLEFRATVL